MKNKTLFLMFWIATYISLIGLQISNYVIGSNLYFNDIFLLIHIGLFFIVSSTVFPFVFNCHTKLSKTKIVTFLLFVWIFEITTILLQFCFFDESIFWMVMCLVNSMLTSFWLLDILQINSINKKTCLAISTILNYIICFSFIYSIANWIVFNPLPKISYYPGHINIGTNNNDNEFIFKNNCTTLHSDYYSFPWFCNQKDPASTFFINSNTSQMDFYPKELAIPEFQISNRVVNCNFTKSVFKDPNFDLDLICFGFHRFSIGKLILITNNFQNPNYNPENILEEKKLVNWFPAIIIIIINLVYFSLMKLISSLKIFNSFSQSKIDYEIYNNFTESISNYAIPMFVYQIDQ